MELQNVNIILGLASSLHSDPSPLKTNIKYSLSVTLATD